MDERRAEGNREEPSRRRNQLSSLFGHFDRGPNNEKYLMMMWSIEVFIIIMDLHAFRRFRIPPWFQKCSKGIVSFGPGIWLAEWHSIVKVLKLFTFYIIVTFILIKMLKHYNIKLTFWVYFFITTEVPEQHISLNWRAFEYCLGKRESWSQKGWEPLL